MRGIVIIIFSNTDTFKLYETKYELSFLNC